MRERGRGLGEGEIAKSDEFSSEKGATRRNFLIGAGSVATGASLGMLALWKLRERKDRRESLEPHIPKFIQEPAEIKSYPVPDNILEIVDQAWEELEKQEAGFSVKTITLPEKKPKSSVRARGKRKTASRLPPRVVRTFDYNVLLASMDLKPEGQRDKNEIHLVKIDKTGNPLLLKSEETDEEGNPLNVSHMVSVGPNMGVGTQYEVTMPDNHVVLAAKRAIKIDDEYREVINTPYSPEFDTPEVRLAGFRYLHELMKKANEELDRTQIKSLAFPEHLATQIVPYELAVKLVIVEQVDPFVFKRFSARFSQAHGINQRDGDTLAMKVLTNRAFTSVGLNGEMSRAYSISRAGAAGLFQLMPGTYSGLRNLYPQANLNPNFREGATEHLNAAKAALLLFDSDTRNAPRLYKQIFLKNREALGEYLAACYNAGAPNIAGSLRQHGRNWREHIPDESKDYVRKFLALERLFKNKVPQIDPSKLVEKNREEVRQKADIPAALRGSSASIRKQREMAGRDRLAYIKDRQDLERMVEKGDLVPLPKNSHIKIDPDLPEWRRFCLPKTAVFLKDLAEATHKANRNFEPIFITSATRPLDTQRSLRRGFLK